MDQVTIWATLTDDTPRTINALIGDPRTGNDTTTPTPGQDTVYHSVPAPMAGVAIHPPTMWSVALLASVDRAGDEASRRLTEAGVACAGGRVRR
jgi:hypothetical protein